MDVRGTVQLEIELRQVNMSSHCGRLSSPEILSILWWSDVIEMIFVPVRLSDQSYRIRGIRTLPTA